MSTLFNPAIAYRAIFERLERIEGVRAVKDGVEAEELFRAPSTGHDRYVYLFFDTYEPTGDYANRGRNLTYQITYSIYLISKSYAEPQRIVENGEILGRIITSLSGWNPCTDHPNYRHGNLINTVAGKTLRENGTTIYPVQFQHKLTIGHTP